MIVVVMRNGKYLRIINGNVIWVDDLSKANKYYSKYSAKKQLRNYTLREGSEFVEMPDAHN